METQHPQDCRSLVRLLPRLAYEPSHQLGPGAAADDDSQLVQLPDHNHLPSLYERADVHTTEVNTSGHLVSPMVLSIPDGSVVTRRVYVFDKRSNEPAGDIVYTNCRHAGLCQPEPYARCRPKRIRRIRRQITRARVAFHLKRRLPNPDPARRRD